MTFAVACGDGGGADVELSAEAERGKQLAQSSGCAGCHGGDGQGGVGPKWQGLAGSEVELADGSTVIADTEYLRRSITDPSADLLADYSIQMPENNLDDDQVDAIVTYIEELRSVGADGG